MGGVKQDYSMKLVVVKRYNIMVKWKYIEERGIKSLIMCIHFKSFVMYIHNSHVET